MPGLRPVAPKGHCHQVTSAQCLSTNMTMQERYYGEKLHINAKDPASCRKVVEDFVQARFGHLPIALMALQAEDSARLAITACVETKA